MEVWASILALAGLALLFARRRRAQGAREPAAEDEDEDDGDWDEDEAVEMPIDGTLDLHTFSPKEVGDLVSDYLDACRARGVLDVRIVHGKGKGVLRRTVWASLERHSAVERFELAGPGGGGWGATQVRLRPPEDA